MARHDSDLTIVDVKAYPTSFPVKPADSISLGIGRVVKRDTVIVKVTGDRRTELRMKQVCRGLRCCAAL